MVLEVSVADRDAVWSLRRAPIMQCRSLGIWSKDLPYSVGNYPFFEKQLLACY